MFLDDTYFKGELYLPMLQKSDYGVGKAAILQSVGENNLNWYIERYEMEALGKIVGEKLRDEMIEGLESDTPEKWEKLRDAIFVKRGDYAFSPVANYVYCMIMAAGKTQTSMSGEVRKKTDTTSVAYIRDKYVKAWNDMGKMIGDVHMFIMNNDYGTITPEVLYWFKPINTFGI